jgi:hypothetical protein
MLDLVELVRGWLRESDAGSGDLASTSSRSVDSTRVVPRNERPSPASLAHTEPQVLNNF